MQLDAALAVAEQLKRPILRMPDKEELAAMDRLVMEVASPRTKRLLTDYRNDNKVTFAPDSAYPAGSRHCLMLLLRLHVKGTVAQECMGRLKRHMLAPPE